jgi:NAD(P)-dependent dehydrogenase (short-subunit alcohol dehydrogenase family)
MPSVLVTGAGRGIGKAIDEHLASRGWDVIAGIRNERDATAVTALNPQQISSVILDVTDSEHIAALTESLPERLDAIVNNAGVVVSGPMETVTTDEWRKQLEINVIGQIAVTRVVLPRLRTSHGRAVFISSVNGPLSMPLIGTYCASKPRARYVVGVGPKLQVALMTKLPAWARDRVLRRVSGQP